jgi:hypothetical protein
MGNGIRVKPSLQVVARQFVSVARVGVLATAVYYATLRKRVDYEGRAKEQTLGLVADQLASFFGHV